MEIVNHPLCDTLLASSDTSVLPLPVLAHTSEHGRCAISFWKPSPDELATLVAGGDISLWVYGDDLTKHPVVAVGVQVPLPVDNRADAEVELRDAWEATGKDAQTFDDWLVNMANDPNGTLQQAAAKLITLRKAH